MRTVPGRAAAFVAWALAAACAAGPNSSAPPAPQQVPPASGGVEPHPSARSDLAARLLADLNVEDRKQAKRALVVVGRVRDGGNLHPFPNLPLFAGSVGTFDVDFSHILGRDAGQGLQSGGVVGRAFIIPAMTNDAGEYIVVLDGPGPYVIEAGRRGFKSDRRRVAFRAGVVDTVDFDLARTAPPCCSLVGTWAVRIGVTSDGMSTARPSARLATGSMSFEPGRAEWAGSEALREAGSAGTFDVDLSHILAGGAGQGLRGGGVAGRVFDGDSVFVDLVYGVDHAGLSMYGRIAGDTIRGRWEQDSKFYGSAGTVLMVRDGRSRQ